MNFIKYPNLPSKHVKTLIMSGSNNSLCSAITKMGLDVIKINPISQLHKPENHHADIQVHHLGGSNVIVANNINTCINIPSINIQKSTKDLERNYPLNIPLNCTRIYNKLIANIKYTDPKILDYCAKENIKIIDVKQGYAKCSTAVINHNSIITSDETIHKACIKNQIDSLKITPGYISLPGYDYGFIGGCCGLLSPNKIIFTGNIELHPDSREIIRFISSKNIDIVCLSTKKLVDIGGIIPLME